jgi:hypothetical protein
VKCRLRGDGYRGPQLQVGPLLDGGHRRWIGLVLRAGEERERRVHMRARLLGQPGPGGAASTEDGTEGDDHCGGRGETSDPYHPVAAGHPNQLGAESSRYRLTARHRSNTSHIISSPDKIRVSETGERATIFNRRSAASVAEA